MAPFRRHMQNYLEWTFQATESFKPGDVIFTELPFLVAKKKPGAIERMGKHAVDPADLRRICQSRSAEPNFIARANKISRKAVENNCGHDASFASELDYARLANACNRRGFSTDDTQSVALYENTHYMSHGCKPNAVAVMTRDSPEHQITVRAILDIAKGDHISIGLISAEPFYLKWRKDRKDDISREFGRTCSCAACKAPESQETRAWLEKAQDLWSKRFGSFTNDPVATVEDVEAFMELRTALHELQLPRLLFTATMYMVEACTQSKLYSHAKEFAEQTKRIATTMFGQDHIVCAQLTETISKLTLDEEQKQRANSKAALPA